MELQLTMVTMLYIITKILYMLIVRCTSQSEYDALSLQDKTKYGTV